MMSEATEINPRQKKYLTGILRALVGLFLFIAIAQAFLYFSSDWLLRGYIQRQVDEVSGGKYRVGFDNFRISLIERGFYLTGMSLEPVDSTLFDQINATVYQIDVPDLQVKGLGFRFADRVLTVGQLRLRQPMVRFRQPQGEQDTLSNDYTPLRQLEIEIQRSFGENLKDIVIGELFIDDADLLMENFISQKSIKAEETNLYVKNLHLAEVDRAIPFNAEGFALNLKNFGMMLADSIHFVSATAVQVSTLEKLIAVEKVRIIPNLEIPAEIYYEIDLENLALRDADIDQIFYTSDVNIGNLQLLGPRFTIYTDRTAGKGRSESGGEDLYDLIQDILSSISIANLNIQSGYFLQQGVDDPNKNRIEAEEIFFHMDQVYIGPNESLRANQFFYAQEAELDIAEVRLVLADGIHWVSGESVMISSSNDKISMERVRISPRVEEGQDPDITLFEVEVPYLNFNKANLKKVYNENVVDVDELTITSPSVLFRDLQGGESTAVAETTSLMTLVGEYLRGIYIKNLQITDGRLVLDNHLRVRQDSLSFGKIDLVLRNFQLDNEVEADIDNKLFFAENLQLDIEDYALKLSDNLHLFTAGRILIDTERELLDIEQFRLAPFSREDASSMLQRYGRTTTLDIEIPKFTARGVDVATAYFDEILHISHIDIPSPNIKWSRHLQRDDEEEDQSGKVDRADLSNLLTAYFQEVMIDSLTLSEGSFAYDNFVNEAFQSFTENDISVTVRKFLLNNNVDLMDSRTLFAEELDIGLNNYVFNIADGRYQVVADRIAFNSAREEINTFNVRLRPQRNQEGKVSISATIPDMSIGGVDLEAFLFENQLALSRLILTDAAVKISINRTEDDDDVPPTRRDRNLPKTIDVVRIGEIVAANASLNVAYNEEGREIDLIKTGINIAFSDFMLDSAKLAEGDIGAFFANLSLEVDDFSLALKDSIHTVHFSNIDFNTGTDEIIVENLRVSPSRYDAAKGIPVINAVVPKARIVTRSLEDLQRTGDMEIAALVLTNPKVEVYLDKDEVTQLTPFDERERIKQAVIQSLRVQSLQIDGGELAVLEKESREEVNRLGRISMMLSDLSFDLSTATRINTQFFLNNDYQFQLNDYEIKLPDSLNSVFIKKIRLADDRLTAEGVSLVPRYGRYFYGRKVGHQVDVAEVSIKEIVIEGLDVSAFVEDQKIIASRMIIVEPDAVVFRDKRIPRKEGVFRPMPQQLIMELKAHVDVNELVVEDGRVIYEEFPEKGMVPGFITFSQMNALLSPLRMTGEKPDSMRVKASMMLNGSAPLDVEVDLGFEDPYPVTVVAGVGEFSLREINSILETNAFITVESGIIRGGEWYFTADKHSAIGQMTLRYNDLKVRLLEERTLEIGRGRKGILTFVVNALALRSNNPRKLFNRLVSSNIYYPRDTDRFIFNYMWKATFSGLMGSSGIAQPKIPRKEENE